MLFLNTTSLGLLCKASTFLRSFLPSFLRISFKHCSWAYALMERLNLVHQQQPKELPHCSGTTPKALAPWPSSTSELLLLLV